MTSRFKGGGCVKNVQIYVTSFMDDPLCCPSLLDLASKIRQKIKTVTDGGSKDVNFTFSSQFLI